MAGLGHLREVADVIAERDIAARAAAVADGIHAASQRLDAIAREIDDMDRRQAERMEADDRAWRALMDDFRDLAASLGRAHGVKL